ncbi:MAG: hypothetical protein CM1200mP30_04790 [Pseudomonadota bacterium]|nr:MAG: hypothetical protein CM1200mP30_04790 [Pseudomonadota bacterium]
MEKDETEIKDEAEIYVAKAFFPFLPQGVFHL